MFQHLLLALRNLSVLTPPHICQYDAAASNKVYNLTRLGI